MLVYATHTGTRDITERMDDILTRHGFRVAVMKADAVAPERQGGVGGGQGETGHRRDDLPPQAGADRLGPHRLPDARCWYETEFSVFQSTQKSKVLMGSRFGCDWR